MNTRYHHAFTVFFFFHSQISHSSLFFQGKHFCRPALISPSFLPSSWGKNKILVAVYMKLKHTHTHTHIVLHLLEPFDTSAFTLLCEHTHTWRYKCHCSGLSVTKCVCVLSVVILLTFHVVNRSAVHHLGSLWTDKTALCFHSNTRCLLDCAEPRDKLKVEVT